MTQPTRDPLTWRRIRRGLRLRLKRIRHRRRARRDLAAFEQAAPGGMPSVRPADLGRLVAFHLPQFHPIPENDEWWGRGFTEWTNVVKARPSFPGHRQPRLPADLGFYDLRLPQARAAQAELAARYGIEAFCYWHYWFGGRRLLERPFEEILASGEPRFRFCLSWANESWTRTWLGRGESLMEQTYSEEDDAAHTEWLARAFADDRYLRVDGRPLFMIYRPADHPDVPRFKSMLTDAAARHGVPEPLLLGMNGWKPYLDARTFGADGTLDFQPQLGDLPGVARPAWWPPRLVRNARHLAVGRELKVYDHGLFYKRMVWRRFMLDHETVPSILVGWDNTPRRGRRATVVVDSTPERFRKALADHLVDVARKPAEEQLIFLNAWNEWAEGNYLEPDDHHGLAWLEAIPAARADAARRLGATGTD